MGHLSQVVHQPVRPLLKPNTQLHSRPRLLRFDRYLKQCPGCCSTYLSLQVLYRRTPTALVWTRACCSLLWTPHNLASVCALRAQLPTDTGHRHDFSPKQTRPLVHKYSIGSSEPGATAPTRIPGDPRFGQHTLLIIAVVKLDRVAGHVDGAALVRAALLLRLLVSARVQGSGFRVQGSGFRVQGSGFRNLLVWRPTQQIRSSRKKLSCDAVALVKYRGTSPIRTDPPP